jgi:hypothetical protein
MMGPFDNLRSPKIELQLARIYERRLLRTQQMILVAWVAATTVQTTPIDPARDVVRMKAGIHVQSVAKVVKCDKQFFSFFYELAARMKLEPPPAAQFLASTELRLS